MPTARGGGDASAPATFAHPLCHLQRLVPEGSHTAHAAVHSSVRDVSAAGGGDGLEPKAALLSLRAGREGHDCIVHGWQARGATGGEEVAAGEPSTALEIVEPGRGIVRLLPFLRQGAEQGGAPLVGACALASGELLTAQADGTLRVWEVEGEAVRRELELWRRMYGVVDTAEVRLMVADTEAPSPHVTSFPLPLAFAGPSWPVAGAGRWHLVPSHGHRRAQARQGGRAERSPRA